MPLLSALLKARMVQMESLASNVVVSLPVFVSCACIALLSRKGEMVLIEKASIAICRKCISAETAGKKFNAITSKAETQMKKQTTNKPLKNKSWSVRFSTLSFISLARKTLFRPSQNGGRGAAAVLLCSIPMGIEIISAATIV